MAAPHHIEPAQLLEQHLQGASPDLLRQMIASLANAMMSAEADQACGAGWGERSSERTNRRNGYRAREWDTRAGTVELAVPKLREGTYSAIQTGGKCPLSIASTSRPDRAHRAGVGSDRADRDE